MGRTWQGRPTRDWRAHLTDEEKAEVAALEAEQVEARKIIAPAATKRQRIRHRAGMRAERDGVERETWRSYLKKDESKIIGETEHILSAAKKRRDTAAARLRLIRTRCIVRAAYVADIPASRAKARQRVNAWNAKKRQT